LIRADDLLGKQRQLLPYIDAVWVKLAFFGEAFTLKCIFAHELRKL